MYTGPALTKFAHKRSLADVSRLVSLRTSGKQAAQHVLQQGSRVRVATSNIDHLNGRYWFTRRRSNSLHLND